MKNFYILDEYVSSQTNGIGSFLKAYISCLKKTQCVIYILTFNAKVKEFEIINEDGITKMLFPYFPIRIFCENFKIIDRFLKLYIKDSIENIFCFNHSPCKDLLTQIRFSFPLSRLIFTIHDMGWTNMLEGDIAKFRKIICHRKRKSVAEQYQHLLDFFDVENEMFRIVDAVVCLSGITEYILYEQYKIENNKVHLISNGIEKDKKITTPRIRKSIRQQWHIKAEEKVLLFVGRLSKSKGVYALLAAFEGILKDYPETKLILAGTANKEWSKFFARTKYIASRLIVTGFIDRNELKKLYAIADVGIIPSYFEQCPYVGIEMMMYGVPVIASDGIGLQDMFTDNINAKIAHIDNWQKESNFSRNLQMSISELLSSGKLREKLSKQAKRYVESKYSVDAMYKRYQLFWNKF